jgi:hypothetical protein
MSSIEARATEPEIVTMQTKPSRVFNQFGKVADGPLDGEELPLLPLPGHGEKLGDCGDERPHFCSNCAEHHAVGRTCHRKQCPRCAPAWAKKRATAAVSKLEAFRRYLTATRGDSPLFHHCVLSPPDGFEVDSDDPLDAGYELVKEILDELGIDGAMIIYHPWRGENGDDRGFWKDLLFDGNEWGETVDQLEPGPHFHIIAVADFVQGGAFTKRLNEETGWTFKRITKGGDESESNVSIYSKYDLARAVTYSLSHAGVSPDHDAYRYTGRLHNFSAKESIEREMKGVVASVAPNTLGLPYRSTNCIREIEEDDEVESMAAGGGGGVPRDIEEEVEDDEPTTCGGEFLHFRELPRYLTDEEWRERVGDLTGLIEAYGEWRGYPPP